MEGLRLTCLATRNPESVNLVDADCKITAEWRELFNSGDLDGVIIATPPALHAEMARAAVTAGMPVLVEKPLTLNLAEARELREFSNARSAFVMVAQTQLFHPAYRTLKRVAQNYGSVRAIRTEAGNREPFRENVPVLWDWGSHDVAICLDLLGALPLHAGARVAERCELQEGHGEIVEIRLEFPGEIAANIRVGNIMPKHRTVCVLLDEGVLVYDDLAASKLVYIEGKSDLCRSGYSAGTAISIDDEPPLHCVLREFAAAIAGAPTIGGGLDLAVDVVRVLSSCENQFSRS